MLVGPAGGVSGRPWAETWLRIRRDAGLKAAPNEPFLPMVDSSGARSKSRMQLSDANDCIAKLYAMFVKDRDLPPPLQPSTRPAAIVAPEPCLGTHSCKATPLSWAAKSGMGAEARKWLGGHLNAGDESLLAYSRDSLAGPLRELEKLYSAIQSGEFNPDCDRSGRWRDCNRVSHVRVSLRPHC